MKKVYYFLLTTGAIFRTYDTNGVQIHYERTGWQGPFNGELIANGDLYKCEDFYIHPHHCVSRWSETEDVEKGTMAADDTFKDLGGGVMVKKYSPEDIYGMKQCKDIRRGGLELEHRGETPLF